MVTRREGVGFKLAAWQDFAIDFHGQAFGFQVELFEQFGGGRAVRHLFRFAVDYQFHSTAFYRKSCIGVDSMHK